MQRHQGGRRRRIRARHPRDRDLQAVAVLAVELGRHGAVRVATAEDQDPRVDLAGRDARVREHLRDNAHLAGLLRRGAREAEAAARGVTDRRTELGRVRRPRRLAAGAALNADGGNAVLLVGVLALVALVTLVALGSPLRPVSPLRPASPFAPVAPCGPTGPWAPWAPAAPCAPVAPRSPLSAAFVLLLRCSQLDRAVRDLAAGDQLRGAGNSRPAQRDGERDHRNDHRRRETLSLEHFQSPFGNPLPARHDAAGSMT